MEQWPETNFVSLLASLLTHVKLQTKKTGPYAGVNAQPPGQEYNIFSYITTKMSFGVKFGLMATQYPLCRRPYSLLLDPYNIGAMIFQSTDSNCGTRTVKEWSCWEELARHNSVTCFCAESPSRILIGIRDSHLFKFLVFLSPLSAHDGHSPPLNLQSISVHPIHLARPRHNFPLSTQGSEGVRTQKVLTPCFCLLSALHCIPRLKPDSRSKRSDSERIGNCARSSSLRPAKRYLCYANAQQSFLGDSTVRRGKKLAFKGRALAAAYPSINRGFNGLVLPRGITKYYYSTLE